MANPSNAILIQFPAKKLRGARLSLHLSSKHLPSLLSRPVNKYLIFPSQIVTFYKQKTAPAWFEPGKPVPSSRPEKRSTNLKSEAQNPKLKNQ